MKMQKTFKDLKKWADKQPDFMDMDFTHEEIEDQEFKWGEERKVEQPTDQQTNDFIHNIDKKIYA